MYRCDHLRCQLRLHCYRVLPGNLSNPFGIGLLYWLEDMEAD